MTTPPGTRLILVSEDLWDILGIRDDAGRRLTVDWGEPTEEGWYEPTITSHDDDPLEAVEEAARLRDALEKIVEIGLDNLRATV